MSKKLRDPSFSPFVAPSRKGVHPHTFQGTKGTYKDPKGEDGYEFVGDYEVPSSTRKQMVPQDKQLQTNQQQPKAGVLDWMLEHPFLSIVGIIAIASTANKYLSKEDRPKNLHKNPSDESGESPYMGVQGRSPAPLNAPYCPPVTVVFTPGYTAPTQQIQGGAPDSSIHLPAPDRQVQSTSKEFSNQEKDINAKADSQEKPKIKVKVKHPRITTQARTKDGKFLPKGTAKKHVEGITGAAAKSMLEARGKKV